MKKFFSILIILALILGGWYFYKSNFGSTSAPSPLNKFSKPNPENASFAFDDGVITLQNGIHSESIIPGSELKQETTLTNTIDYGDINEDGKDDAVFVLVQIGGGSGVFIYLGGYVSGPLDYKGSNVIFVGDRVEPKSISVESGVVTLKYLDRKPSEPYAAEPTVLTTKQFVYRNGQLVER